MNLTIRNTFARICIAALVPLLLGLTPLNSLAAGQETKHVFVLNSYHQGYPFSDNEMRGIFDAFGKSDIKIETYVTYMDMKRIPITPQHFSLIKELIKEGYNGVRFDAVLACDNDALEFMRKFRDELFPGVPVIFTAINDFDERMLDGRRDITGTTENADYAGTISIALKLRPATKNIVVVTDNTTTGKAHRSEIGKIRPNFPQYLDFTYLSLADTTLDELAQKLSRLNNDSIVLLVQHFVDKNGTSYAIQESALLLAKSSAVPVFVTTDSRMGLGVLGGHLISGYFQGETAAQMALKVLQGAAVSSIPMVLESPNRYMFDYSVMKRFNIAESNLPQGSILINKPVSMLDKFRPYLFAILGAFIVLSGFVVYLLFEIRRRKQVEEVLRESEERNRRIIETSLEGIWILNEERRTTFVNKRFADMLGYAPEEMIGKRADSFIFERDLEDHALRGDIRRRGVAEVFERRLRRKDGSTIWTIVSSSPLFDGQGRFTGAFAMFTDITERKQAEVALLASENAARLLAQESELIAEIGRIISSTLNIEDVYERFSEKVRQVIPFDSIVVNAVNMQDHTRTVRYANGCLMPENYLGKVFLLAGTRTEHVVHAKSSLLINSKNREAVNKKLPDMMLQFRSQSMMMVPLISKDEAIGVLSIHSVEIDAYSEHDLRLAEKVASQIAGAIANAQLFLERTQAEEERKKLEERLQRGEKMEALGQLAGGVAHDLNNVLGILTGYSELLLGEIPEESRSRIYVEKILQSTVKGAAIIQDLLTLARRGVVVSDVINLNAVISDYFQTPVFEKLKDHHPRVTFRIDYDKNLLNIKGSPVHLEKTLMNLVSNAAESIAGAGEVTIRTESRYLDKPLHAYDKIGEGDYALLIISDTGSGIPVEDSEKIFEPFYTKKKMGRSGTGLGLAIVWGTVKDHNGYIDVQTDVGKGTTFTLYFPVTQEELIAQQEKIPLEQYRGQGESVLVVDDIDEQREIASRLLTRLGYEVHLAASGEEAVEYLKSNKADILVLDMIMMPGIDGLETYKRILEISPQQKAIIVSGFSETDRTNEAQKLGARAYIKKPYVLEKIGMALRDELLKVKPGIH